MRSRPVGVAQLAHLVGQLVDAPHHLRAFAIKRLAHFGQAHVARAAMEQRRVDELLELLDAVRHDRAGRASCRAASAKLLASATRTNASMLRNRSIPRLFRQRNRQSTRADHGQACGRRHSVTQSMSIVDDAGPHAPPSRPWPYRDCSPAASSGCTAAMRRCSTAGAVSFSSRLTTMPSMTAHIGSHRMFWMPKCAAT